jgi:hypothetical protein
LGNTRAQAELRKWLEQTANDRLSDTERRIVRLYYVDGYDDSEAARLFQIHLEVARDLRQRAIEKLAEVAKEELMESEHVPESEPEPSSAKNERAIQLLQEWQCPPGVRDEDYWDDLEKELRATRLRFRDLSDS